VEIQHRVEQIRASWPEVRIILRGDSGFCRNELMSWCEQNRVDYVFGLARNQRLRRIIGPQMWEATQQWSQTEKPARVFTEFSYQTRKRRNSGWDRERRVVAKAEHIDGKENPRFVVTSLSAEHAGRSDADVLFGYGLRAEERLAALGAEEHGTGGGASVYHWHALAEDRRAGAGKCAPRLLVDGDEVPVGLAVRSSSRAIAGFAFACGLRGPERPPPFLQVFWAAAAGGALPGDSSPRLLSGSFGPWRRWRVVLRCTRCSGVRQFSASPPENFPPAPLGEVNAHV
jgi:Transposase DDE domain group 1